MIIFLKHPLISENWEQTSSGENETNRRFHLYRTQAEIKNKNSSPVNNCRNLNSHLLSSCRESKNYKLNENLQRYKSNNNLLQEIKKQNQIKSKDLNKSKDQKQNRFSMPLLQRAQSTPEFEAELREATKRLRSVKVFNEKHSINNCNELMNKDEKINREKLKTLDYNKNRTEAFKLKPKQTETTKLNNLVHNQLQTIFIKTLENEKKNAIPNTFYFGMNKIESNSNIKIDNSENNLTTLQNFKKYSSNSSSSNISSEIEIDVPNGSNNRIALKLRPILPKKQLEIPRFSPSAAWKLLSNIETQTQDKITNDEMTILFTEDQIEKLGRLPPLPVMHAAVKSTQDKSGDSGISGDAGPPCFKECSEAIIVPSKNITVFTFT